MRSRAIRPLATWSAKSLMEAALARLRPHAARSSSEAASTDFGGDGTVEGGDETPVDGGRGPSGQLLVDDGLGQRLEPAIDPDRSAPGGVPVTVDQSGQDRVAGNEERSGVGYRGRGHAFDDAIVTPRSVHVPAKAPQSGRPVRILRSTRPCVRGRVVRIAVQRDITHQEEHDSHR